MRDLKLYYTDSQGHTKYILANSLTLEFSKGGEIYSIPVDALISHLIRNLEWDWNTCSFKKQGEE